MAARQSQLALAIQEPVLADISRHLIAFIGAHTREEICREWVLRAGAAGKLAYLADQVGSYWDKSAQVDVVGINRMEKTLILGECKWSPKAMDKDVLAKLVQKTDAVVPSTGTWRVLYVGMARGGWTAEARKFAVENVDVSGDNWQATGMVLTDLAEVDDDLCQ